MRKLFKLVKLKSSNVLGEAIYADGSTAEINTGYAVTGELLAIIKVGEPLSMLRHTRNGIDAIGLFQTSKIKSIRAPFITTENSVYKLTEIT